MKFQVYQEDYAGYEPIQIEACDSENAAEKYAEEYDTNGDYTLSRGCEIYITVENEKGVKTKFKVHAEASIEYYAREVEELK